MVRTVAFLLLGMLCSLAAAADAPKRYAVVVGINDYADPAIPDLKYAESDAKAVYDTLTDPRIGRFPSETVASLLGKGDMGVVFHVSMPSFRKGSPS